MKKRIRNTMLILYVMVFFIACSDEFNTFEPIEYNGKFPDESAKNIELVFSDSGRLNFIISAPLMNKYEEDDPYMDFPEGVHITSFDESGNIQSSLRADYAISIDNTEYMEARHNVVIKDLQKKETIETEKIIWDKRNKRIYSDVEVRQIKADGTINIGDGFEADERFSKYAIRNPRGEVLASDI